METIDELIPLTAEDVKKLEINRKDYTNFGCAGSTIVIFLIAAAAAWLFSGNFSWLFYIFATVALIFLALSALFLLLGSSDNKKVLQDLAEGKKRRLIAPIESKDIVEIAHRQRRVMGSYSPVIGIARQYQKSSAELDLKYSMVVKGITFPLSEKDYLSRFRKGTFVEFEIGPHSEVVLSFPVEIAAA